jgi:hypothetical protein
LTPRAQACITRHHGRTLPDRRQASAGCN